MKRISRELETKVKETALTLESINLSLAEELGSAHPENRFAMFDRASDLLLRYCSPAAAESWRK